tara:strand:+ start:490 stop:897 length:408 start_codon:yes stop_codon:yes gene_type:complete
MSKQISAVDTVIGLYKTDDVYVCTFDCGQYSKKGPCGGDRYCNIMYTIIESSIPDDGVIRLDMIIPWAPNDVREVTLCEGLTKKATVRKIAGFLHSFYSECSILQSHENKVNPLEFLNSRPTQGPRVHSFEHHFL